MSVFIVVLAVPAAAVAIYSIATGKAPPSRGCAGYAHR